MSLFHFNIKRSMLFLSPSATWPRSLPPCLPPIATATAASFPSSPSQTVACVSPPIPMRRGTRSVSPSSPPPSLFSFLSVLYWPLCVMFLLGTPTRSLAHFVLLPPLLPTTETKAERESGRVGVESSPLFMNETRPPLSLLH